MQRDEFLDLLVRHLPHAFVRELPREIGAVYQQAHAEVAANSLVDEPERRMFEGVTRYVYLQRRLRELALRHGLLIEHVQMGSFELTVIVSGSLALTVAALRDEALPQAQYREWLAELNRHQRTPDLFSGAGALQSAEHYAILYHRRPASRTEHPEIGFGRPHAEDATIFEAAMRLDVLMEAYPAVSSNANIQEVDNVRPRPRRRDAEESGQR